MARCHSSCVLSQSRSNVSQTRDHREVPDVSLRVARRPWNADTPNRQYTVPPQDRHVRPVADQWRKHGGETTHDRVETSRSVSLQTVEEFFEVGVMAVVLGGEFAVASGVYEYRQTSEVFVGQRHHRTGLHAYIHLQYETW